MTGRREPPPAQMPVQDERNSLGKPQLFVQLTFGVSWSDRHIPRTHTLSYTSKHLKQARNSGHFPRQEPGHQHRRQDPAQRQHRGEWHHHRDPDRPRGRANHSRPRHHHGTSSPPREPRELREPREPRADERRTSNERGSSAPPTVHDSPWGDEEEEGGPSATLFPRSARTARNAPHVGKDLPTNPARFRLGEDGLPWSASAWPFDPDGDEEEPPFANLPTTLPLSPPNRRHSEDPQRARELESLSTAMVTVDNGFENQWWNQGERESTAWLPSGSAEEDVRPMSMADAVLLSAAEPPSGVETYSPNSESFRDLVSPLSDFSPSFNISSPLQRSNSTRSDELWMGR
ncbi:hypothetical protein F4824DRAFT_404126 [Ustulina deusta]|nr:hypothetical protein F4824DRAFT_404126 [Ustulina deusta]